MNDDETFVENPEKLLNKEIKEEQTFVEGLEKPFNKESKDASVVEQEDKSDFRRNRAWLYVFTTMIVLPGIFFCVLLKPAELRVVYFLPSGILGVLAIIWGHVYSVSIATFLMHRIVRYKE